MKKVHFARKLFCLVFLISTVVSCFQSVSADVQKVIFTDRLLLAYDASEDAVSGSVYTNINRGSTLNVYKCNTTGFDAYYFSSKYTAAVTNNLLENEEERFRVFPDKSYALAESQREYYPSCINDFENKYLSFSIAAAGDFGSINSKNGKKDIKIGLSYTVKKSDNEFCTDVMYVDTGGYVDLDKLSENVNTFFDVAIPVKDILEKGGFKALGSSVNTTLDTAKINGFAVSCSVDTAKDSSQHMFMLADVAVTSVRRSDFAPPEKIKFSDSEITWNPPKGEVPNKYTVYRNNTFVEATSSFSCSAYLPGSYSVCAVYDGGESYPLEVYVPDKRIVNSESGGTDLGTVENSGYMFSDSVCGNVFGNASYASAGSDAVYSGTSSFKIVLRTDRTAELGYAYTSIANVNIRCLDYDRAALQFMYNPVYEREETYVGLTCCSNDGNISAIKISLKDYIALEKNDYGSNSWIKVTIPVSFILKNGVFDSFRGSDTQFEPMKINGVMFGYSTENMPSVNTVLAYADEIRLVNSVAAPEDIKFFTDDSSVTLSWNGDAADGYKIYRNDSYVTTVNGVASYKDTDVSSGESYTYSVCAVSDSGVCSVAASSSVIAGRPAVDGYKQTEEFSVSNAVYSSSENRACISWDGSDEADGYIIFKNSVPYGASESEYFQDYSYTDGDVYSVCAADYKAGEVSAMTEVNASDKIKIGELNISARFTDEDTVSDKFTADICNTLGYAKKVSFIIACYRNENLSDVRIYDKIIPFGKTKLSMYPEFYTGTAGEYLVKAFVFDNITNCTPLAEAVESDFVTDSLPATAYVNVLEEEYQTVSGWGVSPFLITDNDFVKFDDYSDWSELYDKLYGELGITSIRVPMDKNCGDENGIVTNLMDYRVSYIQRAREKGIEDYILCFWSPPGYMIEKRDVDLSWTDYRWFLIEGYEDEYCDYIVDCLEYLENSGVGLPSGLSFQNEPQGGLVNPYYPLEQYKTVAKTLRQKMNDAGFEEVLITGPETSAYYNCYNYTGGGFSSNGGGFNFSKLADDADYADALGVLCTHTYIFSDSSNDADVTKYAAEASAFPDKERWQTEFSGLGSDSECLLSDGTSDMNMGTALFTMRVLSSDVGWAGMNRWYYWRGYTSHYNLDDSGASFDILNNHYGQQTLLFGQQGGAVRSNKLYDCLRILFNNVPVGSRVKKCACSDSSIVNTSGLKSDLLAFETNKGTVVMLINISEDEKSISFSGLTGTKAKVYSVSSASESIISAEAEISANIHIPKRSVNFIISSDNGIN